MCAMSVDDVDVLGTAIVFNRIDSETYTMTYMNKTVSARPFVMVIPIVNGLKAHVVKRNSAKHDDYVRLWNLNIELMGCASPLITSENVSNYTYCVSNVSRLNKFIDDNPKYFDSMSAYRLSDIISLPGDLCIIICASDKLVTLGIVEVTCKSTNGILIPMRQSTDVFYHYNQIIMWDHLLPSPSHTRMAEKFGIDGELVCKPVPVSPSTLSRVFPQSDATFMNGPKNKMVIESANSSISVMNVPFVTSLNAIEYYKCYKLDVIAVKNIMLFYIFD